MKFLTVLRTGGEYNADHVHALRRQVEHHIPQADFICLTNANLNCQTIKLTESLPGWWSKMELFKVDGPCLYADLDTMIVGNCDNWLEAIADREFVCLRDPYRGKRDPNSMGSGIMYWSGDMQWVFEDYKSCNMPTTIPGGDQEFLEQVIMNASFVQDFTNTVVSYKADCRDGDYNWRDASIVYFHGKPRPWDQKDIPWS
jgi:hypothetical protein